jgi:uncharacterized protein HemX
MTTAEEEKETLSSPPPTKTPEKKKRRAQPVVIYLTILTLVVVAMLSLSYAMQQRNSKHLDDLNETVTGIQSSYDTMITINDLQAQLNTLNAQLDQDEEQLDAYAQQVEDLQAQLETTQGKEISLEALESLLILENAYNSQDMTTCQALIQKMEDNGDAKILLSYTWQSEEASTTYTTAQRYTEIKDAVAAYFAAQAETTTAAE